MNVHVGVFDQGDQRPEDAHLLADPMIRLVGRHVIEREADATPRVQVLRRRERQERHDGARIEEVLVIRLLNRQVPDRQCAVPDYLFIW